MKHINKHELYEVRERISAQDSAILSTVRACHYITSRQLMRLYFPPVAHFNRSASVRNTNRHLFRLMEWGLLSHLKRRIGGVRAGSGANVWFLTDTGHRLLCLDESTESFRRKRHHEPKLQFVKHHLAISEVYVRLHELSRKRKSIALVTANFEPDCWRQFPSMVGGRPAILKPDLYLVNTITVKSGGNGNGDCNHAQYEDYWFMEVDLDTESPAVIVRKCEQYVRYFNSGIEQRSNGLFPRVVWIVPTDNRKGCLVRHITDNFSGVMRELFAVITLDELTGLLVNGSDFILMESSIENPTERLENLEAIETAGIAETAVTTEVKNACFTRQSELSSESKNPKGKGGTDG
jgi:hypothetical protein